LPRQPQKPKNPRAHPDYGRLIKPGDRLACHLCGRAFHHLGNHVKRTHGLEADEYREMFGLMQKSTLMSMARKAKRHVEHLREHQRRAGAILRAISPEERRATKRKFSKRAEYRLDPHLAAVRKAALVKAAKARGWHLQAADYVRVAEAEDGEAVERASAGTSCRPRVAREVA
jgi:hypothetical protein